MSKVQISVEWLFNEIMKHFAFLDFKNNLKTISRKMYRVYAPTLEEYFM